MFQRSSHVSLQGSDWEKRMPGFRDKCRSSEILSINHFSVYAYLNNERLFSWWLTSPSSKESARKISNKIWSTSLTHRWESETPSLRVQLQNANGGCHSQVRIAFKIVFWSLEVSSLFCYKLLSTKNTFKLNCGLCYTIENAQTIPVCWAFFSAPSSSTMVERGKWTWTGWSSSSRLR